MSILQHHSQQGQDPCSRWPSTPCCSMEDGVCSLKKQLWLKARMDAGEALPVQMEIWMKKRHGKEVTHMWGLLELSDVRNRKAEWTYHDRLVSGLLFGKAWLLASMRPHRKGVHQVPSQPLAPGEPSLLSPLKKEALWAFVPLFSWLVNTSRSAVFNSLRPHELWPAKLLCPWNSPGNNTVVGSHSFFQGIFSTQGSNPGLLCGRQVVYHLSH